MIKSPIDLNQMKEKANDGTYDEDTLQKITYDFTLLTNNAFIFNMPSQKVYLAAKKLFQLGTRALEAFRAQIQRAEDTYIDFWQAERLIQREQNFLKQISKEYLGLIFRDQENEFASKRVRVEMRKRARTDQNQQPGGPGGALICKVFVQKDGGAQGEELPADAALAPQGEDELWPFNYKEIIQNIANDQDIVVTLADVASILQSRMRKSRKSKREVKQLLKSCLAAQRALLETALGPEAVRDSDSEESVLATRLQDENHSLLQLQQQRTAQAQSQNIIEVLRSLIQSDQSSQNIPFYFFDATISRYARALNIEERAGGEIA